MKYLLKFILIVLVSTNVNAQTWSQIGQDMDGEGYGDGSGWSVSISADGNTVAIGAHQNNGSAWGSGHVRIYEWNDTSWTQIGQDIDGEGEEDQSGYSVSISADGNTVAIGAIKNGGDLWGKGHVRIYEWNGTSWTQIGQDIDGEAANDDSGYSVSISADGNTVAIGARNNDGNASSEYDDRGHVRVYEWNGTSWTQLGQDIDGEAADDWSGWSVSISADGNTVAIGAPENDGNGSDAGHVRIYEWNGTSWTQLGQVIDGEAAGDLSGYSVSISADGNTVAIGAPENNGNGSDAGHVRIYEWNGTSWTQLGQDIDGESSYDRSGNSVSISADGNTVAIGARLNDGNGSNAGHVRIYEWNGTSWTQIGQDIDGEATSDRSGTSVSISADGNTVAIGAPLNNPGNAWFGQGHVRIFELNQPVSVEEDTGHDVYTYPNPSTGIYQVQGTGSMSVHSVLGELILSKIISGSSTIDLSGYTNGIYTLQLQTEKGTLTRKLIKE